MTDPARLTRVADAVRRGEPAALRYEVESIIHDQLRYADHELQLASELQLALNLEESTPTIDAVQVVEGYLQIDYSVERDALARQSVAGQAFDGAKYGAGRRLSATLPLRPQGLFERVGGECATDHHDELRNQQVISPDHLEPSNLFYFWDPDKASCRARLQPSDLHEASYELLGSSHSERVVYPEYDQLVSDDTLTITALFAPLHAVEHGGKLASDEPAVASAEGFVARLTAPKLGFALVRRIEPGGALLQKTTESGLVIRIEVHGPLALAAGAIQYGGDEYCRCFPGAAEQDDCDPEVLRGAHRAQELVRRAVRESEIYYYKGHSNFGLYSLFADPTVYRRDRYQIIFNDGCNTYGYYTQQVLQARKGEADPRGDRFVDIVNNPNASGPNTEETALELLELLMQGASAEHAKRATRAYSWNRLIRYTNGHAEWRYKRDVDHYHLNDRVEIYGVSGASRNVYQPR